MRIMKKFIFPLLLVLLAAACNPAEDLSTDSLSETFWKGVILFEDNQESYPAEFNFISESKAIVRFETFISEYEYSASREVAQFGRGNHSEWNRAERAVQGTWRITEHTGERLVLKKLNTENITIDLKRN